MSSQKSAMLRRLLTSALAASLLAALATAAIAQTTGNVVGHVFDQAGTPLKGITVTATSDRQIGGAMVVSTDDGGQFRLQGLTPGKFKLTLTAPKLRTLVQDNVQVRQGETLEVDLIMDVETVAEEVKIIEKAPVINMGSTRIGTNFDEEFMNALPLQARSYQGVAQLAAGVGGGSNPQVRGATYFSNNYTVDGFNTTDPVTRTFSQNFSFSAMSNLEVTTAGGGAETADTAGGSFNIVTKSGSNRFEFDAQARYRDQRLQLMKDNLDRGDSRLASLSLYVGGPIIKDKLWFALSPEFIDQVASLNATPNSASHPAFHVYGFNASLKLTYLVTQRNKLELLTYAAPAVFDNILQNELIEAEAEARRVQRTEFAGLTWQYVSELLLVARLGYRQLELDTGPQRCEWDREGCTTIAPKFDLLTGTLRENYTSQSIDQRRTVEFSGHGEWIKDTRIPIVGGHSVRLGWRYEAHKTDERQTVPGDMIIINAGKEPSSRQVFCSNDPMLDNGLCRQNFLRSSIIGSNGIINLYDAWKPTRYFTVKPGVAYHFGGARNDKGREVTDITGFTPHLALIWDPTRDGKTKLQMSADGKLDSGFLALASLTSRQLSRQTCQWDPMTNTYSRNCRSSGGEGAFTVGLPCGPTGVSPDGSDCKTKLSPPRSWEITAGAEREVVPGIAVDIKFIYRIFKNQWEDVETNANWNQGGTELRRDGQFKTSRSQFIYDLQTPDAAERKYRGVTLQMRKREGRLRAEASYTLSRYEGAVDDDYITGFLDNPGQTGYYYGDLPLDSRHDLRALARYAVLPWLNLGVSYFFQSGGPYNRYHLDPVTNSYSRFQARRGYDSRDNLNPDDDLELRLPDLSILNLRVSANLERVLKQKLEVSVDYFNLLALRTTASVQEANIESWGRPTSRLSPSTLVLGLRYRY